MIGDIVLIGCALYVVGFYIWKAFKLRSLKKEFPAFIKDAEENKHHCIRSWHYIKNKKTVALYENKTQTVRALVDDGTYVKSGDKVIEVTGDIQPDKSTPRIVSIYVKAACDGYFYKTNKSFSISEPLHDGTEIFVIQDESKAEREQKKDKEKLAQWPEPVKSEDADLLLSSDMFRDEEKLLIQPTMKNLYLKLDDKIENLCHVRAGQLLGKVWSTSALWDKRIEAQVFAHRDGYLVANRYDVPIGGVLATIYDTLEEAIEVAYPCQAIARVEKDDFSDDIKVTVSECFSIGHILVLSFDYSNKTASLRVVYEPKDLTIAKGDSIDFLFKKDKLHFDIDKNPVKVASEIKQRSCYLTLCQKDLDVFAADSLQKVKVTAKDQEEIILNNSLKPTPNAALEYNDRKIAAVFRGKLNDLGILLPEERILVPDDIDNSSSCYVYIMKDESNGAHKIGISNKPEYREKTLQSDKPFITLLQAKEFPSRTIARAFESALHKTYEDKHLRGEWFKLSDEDVQEIIMALK